MRLPVSDDDRIAARALAGESDALRRVMRGETGLARSNLGAAVARLASSERGTRQQDGRLHEIIKGAAIERLVLRSALDRVSEILGSAGIAWMPIKGMDTADRFFDAPEDRPTRDLDILVRTADWPAARTALMAAGWRSLYEGERRWESYLRTEGYNWQAVNGGVLLECHYRFWGSVGGDFAQSVWSSARRSQELGETAHRMSPAWAFVVSAVHAAFEALPRPFVYAWELHRIARGASERFARLVTSAARTQGVQLPVALMAARAASLWSDESCAGVAANLSRDLRRPERLVAWRASSRGLERISGREIYLARLLARRPCRMGWKSAVRRVWAHPGVVEVLSDAKRPWAFRRFGHLAGRLRLRRRGGRRG